jgi:hypothetical protein
MFKDAEEDEIFSKQFGKERPNMIRCLGIGPTPSSLWGPKATNELLKKENESLRKIVHDLAGQVGTLQVQVANIFGSIASVSTLVECAIFFFYMDEIR